MTIFLCIVSVLIIVYIVISKIKTQSEIDGLKYTVDRNKKTLEEDLSNAKEDINGRLDDAAKAVKDDRKSIADIKEQIDSNIKSINKLKDDLSQVSDSLTLKINDISKRLSKIEEHFKIFTDSEKLRSDEENYKGDEPLPFELDAEQSKAFEKMENTNLNLFITGKAGTGKSYLLKYFYKNTSKKVLVLAPTGISAINVNGVTIHSAFGFNNLKPDVPAESLTLKGLSLNSEKRLALKHIDTLIIDEISMVCADVFEKIDKILKLINNNELSFGGKQVIIFGDIFQLPPVAKKNEEIFLKKKYGGIFFFNSFAYKDNRFEFVELSINHRQISDVKYFNILNNVREGNVSTEELQILNSRMIDDKDKIDRTVIRLYPTKEKAAKTNKEELSKIDAKERTYKCDIIYSKKPEVSSEIIESNLPILETLTIKRGAVVMMVANDPNHRWANGTMGIISYIDDYRIKVGINGVEYEVHKETFDIQETVFEDGCLKSKTVLKVSQYPFVLAYAITIHKSQGMTFNEIACDVSKSFASGQAYVALSRCKSIDGLHLYSPVNATDLRTDSEILDFYNSLKQR